MKAEAVTVLSDGDHSGIDREQCEMSCGYLDTQRINTRFAAAPCRVYADPSCMLTLLLTRHRHAFESHTERA